MTETAPRRKPSSALRREVGIPLLAVIVLAILWELAEYQSFVQKVESLGIYRDTMGDLCLGTSGALVAGLLVVGSRRWHPITSAGS